MPTPAIDAFETLPAWMIQDSDEAFLEAWAAHDDQPCNRPVPATLDEADLPF